MWGGDGSPAGPGLPVPKGVIPVLRTPITSSQYVHLMLKRIKLLNCCSVSCIGDAYYILFRDYPY